MLVTQARLSKTIMADHERAVARILGCGADASSRGLSRPSGRGRLPWSCRLGGTVHAPTLLSRRLQHPSRPVGHHACGRPGEVSPRRDPATHRSAGQLEVPGAGGGQPGPGGSGRGSPAGAEAGGHGRPGRGGAAAGSGPGRPDRGEHLRPGAPPGRTREGRLVSDLLPGRPPCAVR